jgi:hypothetical protein
VKKLTKTVKATVNGKVKEEEITISVPESEKEAVKEYGEEQVLAYVESCLVTDAMNSTRAALKGGEAREKRAKMKALFEALMEDEDLRARVAEETGIDI